MGELIDAYNAFVNQHWMTGTAILFVLIISTVVTLIGYRGIENMDGRAGLWAFIAVVAAALWPIVPIYLVAGIILAAILAPFWWIGRLLRPKPNEGDAP